MVFIGEHFDSTLQNRGTEKRSRPPEYDTTRYDHTTRHYQGKTPPGHDITRHHIRHLRKRQRPATLPFVYSYLSYHPLKMVIIISLRMTWKATDSSRQYFKNRTHYSILRYYSVSRHSLEDSLTLQFVHITITPVKSLMYYALH